MTQNVGFIFFNLISDALEKGKCFSIITNAYNSAAISDARIFYHDPNDEFHGKISNLKWNDEGYISFYHKCSSININDNKLGRCAVARTIHIRPECILAVEIEEVTDNE